MSRLYDERRCSQGFCGARAALDGYGKNRSERGVSGRRNRPAPGTAFGSRDGGRNTSDESPRGSRKAVDPYTWLVSSKIVKCGRGEREPTQDSMFSAGHEPTQDSAFGAGHESTQGSAFGAGHEPTHSNPWDRREGSAQPAGPSEVDTAISNGVGACQPHGVKACQATVVVLRSRLWQAGRKFGDAVGAAFAVLECAIERGDELKLPLDSCIEGPRFTTLSCALWSEDIRNFIPQSTLGGVWEPKQCCPVPKSRGIQCLSESSVARLMYAIFIVNEM